MANTAELISTGDLGFILVDMSLSSIVCLDEVVKFLRSEVKLKRIRYPEKESTPHRPHKKWHSVRYHTIFVKLRLTHALLCFVAGASGGRGGFGGRGGGRGGRGGVGDRGGRGGARGGRT